MFEWFQQIFDLLALIVRYIHQTVLSLLDLITAYQVILVRAETWFSALPPIVTTVAILTVGFAIFFRILGR